MRVSIVTISFNQGAFLERTILSVLNQDYPSVEYILIDAGSTDQTRTIIEKYRRSFSVVVIERDQGPADGLNKGFSLATGEIFGFLNADDVLYEGTLSRVGQFFRDHPLVDVVSGHCAVIGEDDKLKRFSYSDRFSLLLHAYGASNLMQPSTFFRAEAYREAGGFNVGNRSNWDAELFVDMALHGARFGRLKAVLSGYRLHSASITQSRRLHDLIRQYNDSAFLRIIGRKRRPFDRFLGNGFLIVKYMLEPRSLYERLMKGKIYGRANTKGSEL